MDFDRLGAYVVNDDDLIDDFGVDDLRARHRVDGDAGSSIRRFVWWLVRSGHALEGIGRLRRNSRATVNGRGRSSELSLSRSAGDRQHD
ncbi:hypothetical protein [Bradyrhizobium sp. USDA 4474]